MNLLRLALPALLIALPGAAAERTFSVDSNHTVFGFKASTLLFDVPGHFGSYKVAIQGDPDAPANVKVRIEIDAKSVDTANKSRDNHLRSDDFLDASTYPKIVFTSEKAWKDGNKVVVQGSLELHGKKKELQIPFEPATGLNGAGNPTWSYKATLPINRNDFGVGANSVAAKISLKDNVELDLLLVGFFK